MSANPESNEKGSLNMLNKWVATTAVCIVLLLVPAAVSAHTALKSSTPAAGSVIDKPIDEIALEFNTDIEPLSTFEVREEKGGVQNVSGIRVDKNVMTGKLESALPDGTYTVDWKIIGRDGHPVENQFSFTVKLAQPMPQQASESAATSAEARQGKTEPEPEKTSRGVLLAAGAALAIAVVAGFALRGRRRRH